MTSRRKFIKTTGLLGGLASFPAMGLTRHSMEFSDLKFTSDEELFDQIRKQFLIPENRIYLNTGSLGPSPVEVIESQCALIRQLESNPVSENWGALGTQMELVREKVASFINAEPNEILLTRNTTEGLNLIGQSLELKKNDEILTTTLEHGGGEVGIEFLAQTRGAIVTKVELPLPAFSVEDVVKAIEKKITDRTKLVLLSHVNTVTGLLMPFADIAKITRPKGIFLIADGAQAAGMTKVDVKMLEVDAYACSGHKWLLGPKETGFIYIRKAFQDKVRPVFSSSGYAVYSKSSGTRNVASIIGLGVSMDWHNRIGTERIQQHALKIRNYCYKELSNLKNISIISPGVEALSTGIVSFKPENISNQTIFNKMKELEIIVKLLPQFNAIRISCAPFNSKTDIDRFIKMLKLMV